jgi:serine/threonine protein kinase/CRP-like cAMP-binding protein
MPQSPTPVEVFGRYELQERIARGGMAQVYRATALTSGGMRKLLAVKRILPELSSDPEFVSLFIGEAQLAMRLSHSNIVQVFDYGQVDRSHYLAMELVEGWDLTQLLVRAGQLRRHVPVAVGCTIVAEVLRGLEYAHTRQSSSGEPLAIVHRDVSPHNVLVSHEGEVKLTDFGIARARSHVERTRPGILLGKFAYMSPEQARGRDVDHRTDVYAAGITLFETLSGRRLFHVDDPAETLLRVQNPRVPPLSRYNADVSPELDAIVAEALAPEPDRRPASARELSQALLAFVARRAPGFGAFELARFAAELFPERTSSRRTASTVSMRAVASPASAATSVPVPAEPPRASAPSEEIETLEADDAPSPHPLDQDPVLHDLVERLEREPDLWRVVAVAERLARLGRREDADRVARVAALKFAQHGLLAPALALLVDRLASERDEGELLEDIERLPALAGQPSRVVAGEVASLGNDPVTRFLRRVVLSTEPGASAALLSTPLLSYLGPAELRRFAQLLVLKRMPSGTTIIREGDEESSLFFIARGRVVVLTQSWKGERVYLASLAEGDCFGEHSFFTGDARGATVEAVEETWVFEVAQSAFDRVLDELPGLTRALLRFYKERVVSTLLAKSELFGVLAPPQRQSLLARLELELFEPGRVIVREGERSDGFYVVKSGEVEVYTERKGFVFLSKLRSGDFFGEVAALTGQPRTATVRAVSATELLRLSGKNLQALLETSPEVQARLEARVKQREVERVQRMTAGGLLI